MIPEYSASNHYIGEAGAKYFAWQRGGAATAGQIEARKFQPHIAAGDTVLDFGCGGGYTLAAIECRRRIGVEINPAARAAAAANGILCFETLRAVPDASVDVAISNHALEHVPFPIRALEEIRRTLKPGGQLVLVLPIDDWRVERRYDPSDIHHHLHTWTPQLLGNTLAEAGFVRDARIAVRTHAWFPGAARAFGRIPEPLFDALCGVFAAVRRRREIVATARKDRYPEG